MSDINDAKVRILSKVSLGDLIGDSISPQKRSGQIVGLCPFHEENTPSFYVYLDHYHCYGCKAHGDAISYVQKTQGLGFVHALKWLAQKYNIEAPELDSNQVDKDKWQKNAIKSKILMHAQEFFKSQLKTLDGQKVVSYLKNRGFDDEFIQQIGFGFAPNNKNQLVKSLMNFGFTFEDIKDSSLANGTDSFPFDFFQNRLMVPIRDYQGRLIAFGGRTMGEDAQKYKNSRYDKKLILFGFDHARTHSRSKARMIVVEGYMDTLQMWQHGFNETVACQGTALTFQQMRLLSGATNLAYLLFDGDSAGRNANLKIIEDALDTPDVQFKVAQLPDGEDPDSFVKRNGPENLEKILENAIDLIDYVIQNKFQHTHSGSVPEVVKKEILPWVIKIKDPIKKDFLLSQIAKRSGISKNILLGFIHPQQKLNHITPKKEVESPISFDHSQIEALSPLAYELFAHLYYARPGEFIPEVINSFITDDLQHSEPWVRFAQDMVRSIESGLSPSETEILAWESTQPLTISTFIHNIKNKGEVFACKNRASQINALRMQHIKITAKKSISHLKDSLKNAQTLDEKMEILKSISKLQKEIEISQKEFSLAP